MLTFYFVRTGRLWPVIVAHIIQDSIALSLLGPT
jgi:membrane protease YdiL (CAAX protease family)